MLIKIIGHKAWLTNIFNVPNMLSAQIIYAVITVFSENRLKSPIGKKYQ